MDGVLVASGPAHCASWKLVARKHGIGLRDDVFAATFGQRSREIVRTIWGDGLTDEQVRRIDDEKEAVYREMFAGMVPLTIGTREMLAAVRVAGMRLAIATSGPRENVELVLSRTGLVEGFDAIVTGGDVARGKPAPDCFRLAAQRLGLPPRACVVVEDAPVGIEAARAAAMPCIGFVGTHPADRLRSAGCTAIAERMADITPELIVALLRGAHPA